MIPFDIELINTRLLEKYGKTFEGLPMYRVVHADDQTEFRKVDYENGMQLVWPKTIEVKKYPYLEGLWVLEVWQYGSPSMTEVVTTYGGCYEPKWSFRDVEGRAVRPNWKAVELICEMAKTGRINKKTLQQMSDEDKEAFNNEVADIEAELEDGGPNYGNQTDMFVSPMFVDSTKQKMRQ